MDDDEFTMDYTGATHQIVKFDFEKNLDNGMKPHLALVGSGANGISVATLKSEHMQHDITISMSMVDFLTKLFGMWEEDARVLAGTLGFEHRKDEVAYNDYGEPIGNKITADEYIQKRIDSVTILKGKSYDPAKLPRTVAAKILELHKQYDEVITTKALEMKNTSGNSPEVNKSKTTGEKPMDELETLKAKQIADAKELETLKAKVAASEATATTAAKEIEQFKSLVGDMNKQAAATKLGEMEETFKSFSFILPEDAKKLAASFATLDDADLVINTLKAFDSAREAVAAGGMEENGTPGGDPIIGDAKDTQTQKSNDKVSTWLKDRDAKLKV